MSSDELLGISAKLKVEAKEQRPHRNEKSELLTGEAQLAKGKADVLK